MCGFPEQAGRHTQQDWAERGGEGRAPRGLFLQLSWLCDAVESLPPACLTPAP